MSNLRPRRSALYMPGSNARALEKAKTLNADCVILDLEDAVAPEAKDLARDQVVAALKQGGFGHREVVVRINGLQTPWGDSDVSALGLCAPDAILVPKVSTPADLQAFETKINATGAPSSIDIWAMMETPGCLFQAEPIAALSASTRLSCFVLGTNDLAKETGARLVPGRAPMLPWIMTIVAAARLHGVTVLDGVYNDLDNLDGFQVECQQGVDCGLDGKTLIHPKQIDLANTVFAPGDEELNFAKTILAAFALPENADKGALKIDGRMVERLHAEMARKTVAIAEAIARQSLD